MTTITLPSSSQWTFEYDAKGNMTERYYGASSVYTQTFNQENLLFQVEAVGGDTTRFIYDEAGQRVRTIQPDGTILYTPFAGYEEVAWDSNLIQRRTYQLAGQTIAVWLLGDTPDEGLHFLYSDHLGSISHLAVTHLIRPVQ